MITELLEEDEYVNFEKQIKKVNYYWYISLLGNAYTNGFFHTGNKI